MVQYFFIFVHFWDRFRLLLFLVLSGFPFFCALCLLPWLLFPPLCCTCWHLTSNMKIGTAGKYSMCIVLGSFQEGIRPRKDSALIWSQWIHILLLFFLFDLFSFSVFASLLPHSPCWLPSSFDLICSYPSSCVSFLPCTRFMFLVSLPCTSCSPPLFCVYLVLAWQGTHDAGHTCWNTF